MEDGFSAAEGVGERVQMPLIAVGILHLVATKKDGSNPALLASEAVFCS